MKQLVNQKPKIKADDFREHEDGSKQKWTNFEELQAMVEEIKDVVNEHAEILRKNRIIRKEVISAPYYDSGNVFKKLEYD